MCQGSQDQAVQERRDSLERELEELRHKLSRLYRAIEENIIELDNDLRQRIQTLKHERQVAEDALSRLAAQVRAKAALTPPHCSTGSPSWYAKSWRLEMSKPVRPTCRPSSIRSR